MELSLQNGREPEIEMETHVAFRHRPVDLAHLSRYTMGNSAVEREVLELFRRQTGLYFDKLSRASAGDAWREAARVLKASARSVGAWQILQTADAAEQLSFDGAQVQRDEILRTLASQIRDANLFIASVL
jgi:hypothetical protein